MKKVSIIAEKYSQYDCSSLMVKRYFEVVPRETGSYTDVISAFERQGSGDKADDDFYRWVKEKFDKNEAEKTVTLAPLFAHYSKDAVSDFVFNVDREKQKYNQKWHFYISYLLYKEYATKTESKIQGVTPFAQRDGEYVFLRSLNFTCPELILWEMQKEPLENQIEQMNRLIQIKKSR